VVEPAAEVDGATEIADEDKDLVWRPADDESAADHQRRDYRVARCRIDR